jgi:GxxExxY protein
MRVHRELGCGFLEAVYQEAMQVELRGLGLPFESQREFHVMYRGRLLEARYRADLVCYGHVLVELKALQRLSGTEESQLINYLKAAKFRLGLLINFGRPSLEYRRFLLDELPPTHL